MPSLTFVASANAVLYMGATPVFVDITSSNDFSIAPQAIAQAITPATKAVMVVHYGGYPADMAALTTARTQVMPHLASRGIQTNIHYPPTHQFSFYRQRRLSQVNLSKTITVGSCQMTLPLYADMTADQVDYVCACMADALQKS